MGVLIERLHLGKGGLRLVQGGLEGTGIDFEEHLTLLDQFPFVVVLSDQVARDLRPNGGIHQTVGSANPLVHDRDVLLDDLHDLDFRRAGVVAGCSLRHAERQRSAAQIRTHSALRMIVTNPERIPNIPGRSMFRSS